MSPKGRQPGPDRNRRSGAGGGQGRGRGAPGPGQPDGGRAKGREGGLGGDQVEGRRAVRELLAAKRRRVRDVWLADGSDDAPILGEIEALAADAGVPIRRVGRARLDAEALTSAPQGVLAHAAPVVERDLDDLVRSSDGRPPFLLVLDGVTDPGNVGALLRTAHGAGATGVVLPRHRAAHLTPAAVKAAAGAVEYLDFSVVACVPAALK
ncbi:MAG: TrmH family RNA methyltransferase, partial [Acidimicrobiales bacterium]